MTSEWARVGTTGGWNHDDGEVDVVGAMVCRCRCVHDRARGLGTSVSNRKRKLVVRF